MKRDQFIQQYVAAYLASMYVKRSDDHLYTDSHPYSKVDEVPIEDAFFMANVAWLAYERHRGDMSEYEWQQRESELTARLCKDD